MWQKEGLNIYKTYKWKVIKKLIYSVQSLLTYLIGNDEGTQIFASELFSFISYHKLLIYISEWWWFVKLRVLSGYRILLFVISNFDFTSCFITCLDLERILEEDRNNRKGAWELFLSFLLRFVFIFCFWLTNNT